MVKICDGINWEIAKSDTGYAVFAEDIANVVSDEDVVGAIQAHDTDALNKLFPERLEPSIWNFPGVARVCVSKDNPNLLAKFTCKPSLGDAVINVALGEGLRRIQSPTLSAPDYYGYVEQESTPGGVLIMQRAAGNWLSRTAFTRAQYNMIDISCRLAVEAVGVHRGSVAWDLQPGNFISNDPRLLTTRELFEDSPITIIDQPAAYPMRPDSME